MKFILVINFFFIAGAFAEYAPIDNSIIIPISEMPGFWEGREFPKEFHTQNFRSRRIVNGNEVAPNSHPYKVALHLTQTAGQPISLCAGTILSVRSVLTAGHCVARSSLVVVIAGAHNRLITEPTQQRRDVGPANYRVHPNFNPSNFNNNIAILLMPQNFIFNINVGPVRLPTGFAGETFVGEVATSLGWGRMNVTGEPSPVLRSGLNQVMTNAACTTIYGASIINNATLCVITGNLTTAQGACHGDDGGALLVPRVGDTRAIQIGITSYFAFQGCVVGYPIVFTRVTQFLTWIQAIM